MKDNAPLEGTEYDYDTAGHDDNPDWLKIARSAYESSTDFLDAKYRKQFERNVANFQGRHPQGSIYHTDEYKNRNRLFRPKTRIAIRKNEAALGAALFSASDNVVLEAEDNDDPIKVRDALYWHQVLNYRLRKTIPWFVTCIGAFQETMVYGLVISKQYWEYEEALDGEEVALNAYSGMPDLDENGDPVILPKTKIIKDRPKIRLIEIENIRFDPRCDWTDPINSTPYLIELMPMYVGDVLDRMEAEDPETGQPEWYPLEKKQIIAYGKSEASEDTTKKERDQNKNSEVDHDISDFETVWVHCNIVRQKGEDYIYYTLGTKHLLCDPKPLKEEFRHDIRPYAHGVSVIEAHKSIPASVTQLSQDLQAEANHIVNQRLDNVKLVLNKRKYVNSNADIDLHSLMADYPGGVVLMDDLDAVKSEDIQDVTSSAYQEQNRIDTDLDSIAGVFDASSVANNRQLNETVGGMELMSQSASQDTEYLIRVFVETWVEPVLRQLVLLEQHYEEDEKIRDMALKAVEKESKEQPVAEGPGEVAQTPIEEPQNVDVRVNVGFGSLNPDQRIKKVMTAISTLGQIAPWTAGKLDVEEVAKEVFGALGHKNGDRFYIDFEPPQQQANPEIELKKHELEIKEAEMQQKVLMNQAEMQLKETVEYAKLALQEKISLAQLYAKLGVDEKKMQQDRELAGAKNLTTLAEIERKENELAFKERTGRQGI